MKLFSSKRRYIAVAALIVLLLFLLRPGASRLKWRIVSSISSALGRNVDVGSVHIRLLPRPGFDLENLVVYDDPAFGAEPMLRASQVTASLRLTSLVRGRLEIARLDLTEPSLNLVHAEGGHWNLGALLERTAHIPLAPTAKGKSEPRPGFPYIQATSGRINFKNGAEKKPYALTNADFSLWQDSENSWGVRLKAQPFRTDLNLNDTGMLQVSGTWQRAEALRDTPLQFIIEWKRAQLGQFTKLFSGNDQGWRGEVLLDVTLAGTPSKLQIASDGSIDDFRRYDITSGQALRLVGHCDAGYSSLDHRFKDILCSGPVGGGLVLVKGEMGLPGSHDYGLTLTANDVPASAAAVLAQRAKKGLPEDLVASGTISGNLRIEQNASTGSTLQIDGRGEFAELRMSSASDKAEVGLETVPFHLTEGASGSSVRKTAGRKNAPEPYFPGGLQVEIGPFQVAMGHAAPATARGWLDHGGYSLSISGEAEIGKSLRLARMLGLPALQSSAEGSAQVDLQIAGSWAGRNQGTSSSFTGAQVTGTAKLRNVRIALRAAATSIEIAGADMQFLPDEVRVAKINAKTGKTSWTGSMDMPRGCGTPGACQVHFVLNANQIVLSELRDWVSPRERPWYRVLASSDQESSSFLTSVRATGTVTTDHLQVQSLAATRVSAKVSLESGKLQISDLNSDFLGGKHRGQWQADFSVKPSTCNGSGNLTAVSLTDLATAMKDNWIGGTASTSYDVKGHCGADFWSSVEGTLQFEVTSGSLPHIALEDGAEPLNVTDLAGQARLHNGTIQIKDAKVNCFDGNFQLNGTSSLKGELDLRLARVPGGSVGPGYTISGTLFEPKVSRMAASETEARLKP